MMSTETAAPAAAISAEPLNEKHQAARPTTAALDASQIAIVKATAPVLKEHGEQITTLFYQNMLRAHPELNNIFNRTSQATGAQPRALAAAVFAYATHVDDLPKLKSAVERIAHKHASLTIQPEHYAIVGKYLLEAVAAVLGDAVTPEVGAAWTAAYAVLADVFVGRERQLYADHQDWQGWRKFKIQKKVVESADITSFHLVPEDGRALPLFKPGQYLSLRVLVSELGYLQPRQYSLSDRPRSDHYRISVKKDAGKHDGMAGMVSNILHDQYQEGDSLEITHPTGDFFADPDAAGAGAAAGAAAAAPLVLLSAGVGITPMMSILNTTLAAGSTRPVSWVHGARSGDAQAFGEHIQSVIQQSPNVTAHVFRSHEDKVDTKGSDYHFDGRISLDKMDREKHLFLGDAAAEYFICGPTCFMDEARRYLVSAGVDDARIHSEVFGVGIGE